MKRTVAIGMDIGGTNTKLGVVDERGLVMAHASIPTQSERPFSDFVARVQIQIQALVSTCAGTCQTEIFGIGIGAPNANPLTGMIDTPPNLKWGTVPLKMAMQEALKFPVWIDNDANIAAIGEGLFGAACGMKNFIVVTLGTGVGTGVVSEGQLVLGHTGTAGEGGHLMVVPDGRPCGCGGSGHLEAYASATGIQKTILEIMGRPLSVPEASSLWQQGDVKATEVFHLTGRYLGMGLAQMGTLFAPEAFILAGGVASIGKPLVDLAQMELDRYVFPPFKGRIRILTSTISTTDGAVLGGASLAFRAKTDR